jgi:hypothetical protein
LVLGFPMTKVSGSHAFRHKHLVGLLWTHDNLSQKQHTAKNPWPHRDLNPQSQQLNGHRLQGHCYRLTTILFIEIIHITVVAACHYISSQLTLWLWGWTVI